MDLEDDDLDDLVLAVIEGYWRGRGREIPLNTLVRKTYTLSLASSHWGVGYRDFTGRIEYSLRRLKRERLVEQNTLRDFRGDSWLGWKPTGGTGSK